MSSCGIEVGYVGVGLVGYRNRALLRSFFQFAWIQILGGKLSSIKAYKYAIM